MSDLTDRLSESLRASMARRAQEAEAQADARAEHRGASSEDHVIEPVLICRTCFAELDPPDHPDMGSLPGKLASLMRES